MQELKGMPVVKSLTEGFLTETETLLKSNVIPKLSVIRIGERDDDLAYERGIIKRFQAANAYVDVIALPINVTQENLEKTIIHLNNDKSVHGILIFRPLPKSLSEDRIKNIIAPEKDMDCMSMKNIAQVFAGDSGAYPPCTPQAVIELLDYYNIDLTGKKVTVVGRSLVVGKPLSMLLLTRNATVTICHTKTVNLAEECKKADILIACAGAAKMIKNNYVHSDQIVIDVGINMDGDKLCGDVDYEDTADIVKAITPVPGGVGTVTTSVLLKHTIQSAKRAIKFESK
ncbi:MAG: tetrahydrofolate dehydrogenase/cyclohydrolase catalytic domain-containing protein [Bacillota bacterium]|nr:tetrahydrofolate dehydrogenase/cyclohydrolase catalytic domain-containing protein [Bacillota bacterium]